VCRGRQPAVRLQIKKACCLCKNLCGQISLEAGLVLPTVLLLTIITVFAGLQVYRQWEAGALAQITAERLAYAWDHSGKDHLSGRFDPAVSDGLYWRWTADLAGDPLGRFSGRTQDMQLELPMARAQALWTLPAAKLAKAALLVPAAGLSGTVLYRNGGLQQRMIAADLHDRFQLSAWLAKLVGRSPISEQGTARVVDPVELIRLTDMSRFFFPQLQTELTLEWAKRVWVEPRHDAFAETPDIRSEAQAAAYLRKLAAGQAWVLPVPGGLRRVVDAYDIQGVAHMAVYTFSEKQLRSVQLVKDAALLQSGGPVSGIVWHFFKKDALPSEALRRELAAAGIAVVIHQ